MSKSKEDIKTEALKAVGSLHRAGVAGSVGVGKTSIGLHHMANRLTESLNTNPLYLIVGPKRAVYKTWKEETEKFGLEHLVSNMKFCTYRSLAKKDLSMYEGIYLDECHSLLYSHDPVLSTFKGFILGLTGTAPKNELSEKAKMIAKYCPIVYNYTTDEAVEDKILNNYVIYVHHIPLSSLNTLKMEKNGKVWYTSEEKVYTYWTNRIDNAYSIAERQMCRIMRMKAMMDFPSKVHYSKKLLKTIANKVLVFTNTQKQADSYGIASYHSKNPKSEENLEKFKKGDISQMACVLQLSEGINVPKLKEIIVLHAYGNERKAPQRLGRGMRLPPDETATFHVLCFDNTADEGWVNTALEGYDQNKIIHIYAT